MSTTTPVSIGDSEDVVIQLRNELDSLKKEVDTMKLLLTKEVASLKSDYKGDIEIKFSDKIWMKSTQKLLACCRLNLNTWVR